MSLSIDDLVEFFPYKPLELHVVGTTRKLKFCHFCDEGIEKGSSHVAIVWRTGDGYHAQSPVCDTCFHERETEITDIIGAGSATKWKSDLKSF